MNRTMLLALATALVAIASPAEGQQGRPITQQDVEAAQTLYEQMKPACAGGSPNKACGVLAYSPEDCSAKKKDAHIRQVYDIFEDGTVRFQQGNTGVARQRPMALLVGFGIIAKNGDTTRYASPQFVSWDDYQGGKKNVMACGKASRIEARDFTISAPMKKFLQNNQ
jgi:hypothetical protein